MPKRSVPSGRAAAEQAGLDQGAQRRQEIGGGPERRPADGRGRLEGAAADEHAELAEQRLLVRSEQPVAPADGSPQGLVALGLVRPARDQQVQCVAEPRHQHLRRQHLHPGGRELDGQRQAVQASADLGHRRGVLGSEGPARPHGFGAQDEQRYRRCARQLVDRR
jgi:hypothetical protein